jgi:hypothetical protein
MNNKIRQIINEWDIAKKGCKADIRFGLANRGRFCFENI